MANIWFGAAWIVMGLIWIRRAYVGEKAKVIFTLSRPEDRRMNRRERNMAFWLGIANLILGVMNLWVGLGLRRHG